MRLLLTSLVLVAGLAGSAAACINDIELLSHEREFRSQYRGPAHPPPEPSSDSISPPSQRLLLAAGTVLLVGPPAWQSPGPGRGPEPCGPLSSV